MAFLTQLVFARCGGRQDPPSHYDESSLTHAAGTNGAHGLPGAQALAQARGTPSQLLRGAFGHEDLGPRGVVVVGQQAAQFGQAGRVQVGRGNQRLALGRSQVHTGFEQGLDGSPGRGGRHIRKGEKSG